MDEADLAQRYQEQFEQRVLQLHRDRLPKGESAVECQDCGDPIPEARRRAMPGCSRCICCQHNHERRSL